MDRVLIAYAGSAGELALVVGEQFCRAGLGVDIRPCVRAPTPEGYQAVVVGSTTREGRWVTEAADYLSRYADALAERPLWLFSCTDLDLPGAAEEPVRFGPADFSRAREWGFTLGCGIRPLAPSCPR